jgi:hypothetical protein
MKLQIVFFLCLQIMVGELKAQWTVVSPVTPWGTTYGVWIPTGQAGVKCSGKETIYFDYDAAGNRVLRYTSTGVDFKSQKFGTGKYDVEPEKAKLTLDFDAGETDFLVFPNPATDLITISQMGEELKGDFGLYNSVGQLLLSKSAVVNTELEITNLLSGIYLLTFKSGNYTKQWTISKI